MREVEISQVPGFFIGHAQDMEAATGCTVIGCPEGAAAGVDVRGGAPCTRETDLLKPENMVQKIHGVCLSGGSVFGLDAAAGMVKFLEEKGIGFDVQVCKVPIVCSAALFDLTVGSAFKRPDSRMGYEACLNAGKNVNCCGNFGAGTGASVGKIAGMERAVKGGLGSSAFEIDGVYIGALAAVNCLGDVIDSGTGKILAGALNANRDGFADSEKLMVELLKKKTNLFSGNTTIGVILTNGGFGKGELTKLSSMAHDGLARTMRPAHSWVDGDTIFSMSSGNKELDLNLAGMMAAKAMEKAVMKAVIHGETLCGIPAIKDLEFCSKREL